MRFLLLRLRCDPIGQRGRGRPSYPWTLSLLRLGLGIHTYTRLHRRLAYHHKSCSAWVPYTFQKREGVWGQTKELYPQRYFYLQILFLSSPPSLIVKWVKYKLEGVLQWFHHRALVQGLRKAPQLILDIPTINWPMSIAIDAKAPFIVLKGLPSLKTQASQYRALVKNTVKNARFKLRKVRITSS